MLTTYHSFPDSSMGKPKGEKARPVNLKRVG
jgi:hypothetical protein